MLRPEKYQVVSGKGSSQYSLVAFDNALIDAGISDYNLLRVSSILPPNCRCTVKLDVPKGAPLLVAYGTITSNEKGMTIASAVSVALPVDKSEIGVIMEYSGVCSALEAESIVRKMAEEAMVNHGIGIREILSSAVEAIIKDDEYYSVISAIPMW